MDAGLRQDFGFKHILWVYSGRRGVHCWVADDAARALTNEGRGAVADYFSVVAGNDNQTKKVTMLLSRASLAIGAGIAMVDWCGATKRDEAIN